MRRILIALTLATLLLTMCGCVSVSSPAPVKVAQETDSSQDDGSMFAIVEKADSWLVVYHKETKVMYLMSYGLSNIGTFELMVDAEGKPLLWNPEEIKE